MINFDINMLSLLFSLSALTLGVMTIWHVRGGLLAKTLFPIVCSWMIAATVASVELLDHTPRGEFYSDVLRCIRTAFGLLGAYFLWRMVNPGRMKLVMRK